jgi:hypothetical protein
MSMSLVSEMVRGALAPLRDRAGHLGLTAMERREMLGAAVSMGTAFLDGLREIINRVTPDKMSADPGAVPATKDAIVAMGEVMEAYERVRFAAERAGEPPDVLAPIVVAHQKAAVLRQDMLFILSAATGGKPDGGKVQADLDSAKGGQRYVTLDETLRPVADKAFADMGRKISSEDDD